MFRVITSAVLLLAAVVSAVPGWAAGDDRVRPGLGYTVDGGLCSFGFLLAGSDGHAYAATAGHCALAADGEQTWLRGDGPVVRSDQGHAVGRFVYAVEDTPRNKDFALIRLSKGIKGNPQMCGWGGPTRLLAEPRTQVTELHQHGQGIVLGEAVPNRTAVASTLPREPYTIVQGPFAPGDSGSAMTTADGAAVGIVAELVVDGAEPNAGAGIVRLEDAATDASRRLGVRLSLRTAPLLPAPSPTSAC